MAEEKKCCAGCDCQIAAGDNEAKINDVQPATLSDVPTVSTRLYWRDYIGGMAARWGIRRMHYRIAPGLYAIGQPAPTDAVLVTANYKLTFDTLRCELGGRNLWLLVLDTKGVNVWCAAGKGTFSATEIGARIRAAGLERYVSHRTLILPQLAASGVSAQQVKRDTGFTVVYGPVKALHLPHYLDNGRKASVEMRTVTFTFLERLRVVPVEIVFAFKYFVAYSAIALAALFVTGHGTRPAALALIVPVLGAMIAGTVLVPLLLPLMPLRSFVWQGFSVGFVCALAISVLMQLTLLQLIGNLLLLSVLSALLALNFTGSTTFTCQTGVNREIRQYARPMALVALLGVACMLVNLFI